MEGNTQKHSQIGWAVDLMLAGHKMRRANWRSVEYVAFVPKGSVHIPEKFGAGNDTGPFLVAMTVDNGLVPWSISVSDILAEDWEMVNRTQPGEYHADKRTSLQPTET